MLTTKFQVNVSAAKSYFREHLSQAEYYSQSQEVLGEWFGQGAEMLGLIGKMREEDFLKICDNVNPLTGEKWTPRTNTKRMNDFGEMVANRRIFYDFVLSPPKSVSVMGLAVDERISELHRQAVKVAMKELETFAQTKIRKGGGRESRASGNVVGAEIRHDISRELDPHIHTHCVVMNGSFDRVENRWKALESHGLYQAQKFVEHLYYHELSKGLRSLGYEIGNNAQDFEIKGVPVRVIKQFSKRHEEIDAEAKRRIEVEGGDENTVRRQVARDLRKRKVKTATTENLRPTWIDQMTELEWETLQRLRPLQMQSVRVSKMTAIEAVIWAEKHLFERRSTVREDQFLAITLARGRGENFDLAAVRQAMEERGFIRQHGTNKLTTPELLRCELEIVMTAKDGRKKYSGLNPNYQPASALSGEQKTAVEKILSSRDFMMLFRGGAGTGKSFTLKEIEKGLSAANHPVVVLAPQRQQVRDLEADGLKAETLARFLEVKTLAKNAVVIVDEAGQIGGQQLRELIRLVKANGGRLILSGDTRQHGAVAASDALKAIERHSGLKPVVIRAIRRQDPKRGKNATERALIRKYRAAARAASKGKLVESFDQLEQLGWIRELPIDERRKAVAEAFTSVLARDEKALVVAQTREEVREVNEAIRQRLQSEGKLGTSQPLVVCQPVDFSGAEKSDPRFYQPGQHVLFLRSYGRFKKGDLCEIAEANERGLVVTKDGHSSPFSYRYSDRVVVTAPRSMELAPGDRLQMKFNGKSVEGVSIDNGELVTVNEVREEGTLAITGDTGERKTLSANQRVFVRGYAVTSYASQGKSVDTVILCDAGTPAATNAEQWYVSITRGRKNALVFTSDKAALRENAVRSGERELALDLNAKSNGEKIAPSKTVNLSQRALEMMEINRRHAFSQNDQNKQYHQKIGI